MRAGLSGWDQNVRSLQCCIGSDRVKEDKPLLKSIQQLLQLNQDQFSALNEWFGVHDAWVCPEEQIKEMYGRPQVSWLVDCVGCVGYCLGDDRVFCFVLCRAVGWLCWLCWLCILFAFLTFLSPPSPSQPHGKPWRSL